MITQCYDRTSQVTPNLLENQLDYYHLEPVLIRHHPRMQTRDPAANICSMDKTCLLALSLLLALYDKPA